MRSARLPAFICICLWNVLKVTGAHFPSWLKGKCIIPLCCNMHKPFPSGIFTTDIILPITQNWQTQLGLLLQTVSSNKKNFVQCNTLFFMTWHYTVISVRHVFCKYKVCRVSFCCRKQQMCLLMQSAPAP